MAEWTRDSPRQAVVVVHGMGEQLPLDTLSRFIETAIERDPSAAEPANGDPVPAGRFYYSRPETITGSLESRNFLAPRLEVQGEERHAQTEFYEYHWAHLMQGNQLQMLWTTFRRLLVQRPWRVPRGLRVLWTVAWAAILVVTYQFVWGRWQGTLTQDGAKEPWQVVVDAVVSGGVATAVVSYVVSKGVPRVLTTHFVDVVRYLDSSPTSYAVRHEIRKGLLDMLKALHDAGRYDRIVVVAHSLGAFIAYDAIASLWGQTNTRTAPHAPNPPEGIEGLEELERAASAVVGQPHPEDQSDEKLRQRWDGAELHRRRVDRYQAAQRALWVGIRRTGNPWLVTDLVTVGTPMYFADQLLAGRGGRSFEQRVARRELPVCPPLSERDSANNAHNTARSYSWKKHRGTKNERRVLYEGAAFAVVRWTNLYFPPRLAFFGDWFGGDLAPVFGGGIRDVRVTGNRPWRYLPAVAHSMYFTFPDREGERDIAVQLRKALGLASSSWLTVEVRRSFPSAPDLPTTSKLPKQKGARRAKPTTVSGPSMASPALAAPSPPTV